MKNYKEMTFDEIIEYVRSEFGLNDYYPSSVYARNDTFEIFVIKRPDEYFTWFHFYCLIPSSREPVCFRAATTLKDAKRIFNALTT